MVGFVEIETAFPENGGSATSQKGTITLTDYHGKGPYCSVEVESGMIGAVSVSSCSAIYSGTLPDG